MSLKRRNLIACILLLFAAVCWTSGQGIKSAAGESGSVQTSFAESEFSESERTSYSAESINPTPGQTGPDTDAVSSIDDAPVMESTVLSTDDAPAMESTVFSPGESGSQNQREVFAFLLCFLAATAAGAAILVLRQTAPILGPDGVSILAAVVGTAYYVFLSGDQAAMNVSPGLSEFFSDATAAFALLFALRELWGWLRARLSLRWCLVHRISKLCPKAQLSLLVYTGWILLALMGLALYLVLLTIDRIFYLIPFLGFVMTGVFGAICLWQYGSDLEHFKKQLDNYQEGRPITVGSGAFARTESQLLDVQAQHEEAIRTAVTSERFKVELISNVSHDLRTPLTAILGYSELLQQEPLSPKGQEQLQRLHQKAGYMNDLVESLFELTKVSSGVVESRKEEIDLIRLLEQTIGLFDDQLAHAGLAVRRSYCSDAVSIITDGARMHQVFANLLGNAIKYALTGTRIYLEVKETPDRYLIRMVNTASYEMDFKPDEIMQRFARGDKARSTKGSGLGLAIAQTYTESVGGRFRVTVDGDQFGAIVELPKS